MSKMSGRKEPSKEPNRERVSGWLYNVIWWVTFDPPRGFLHVCGKFLFWFAFLVFLLIVFGPLLLAQ